eukprot:406658-Amphidinium_carterae.1
MLETVFAAKPQEVFDSHTVFEVFVWQSLVCSYVVPIETSDIEGTVPEDIGVVLKNVECTSEAAASAENSESKNVALMDALESHQDELQRIGAEILTWQVPLVPGRTNVRTGVPFCTAWYSELIPTGVAESQRQLERELES